MFESDEENCSLQSLVQKRKNNIAKKTGSQQKLKVKIKRKSPKQSKNKLQIGSNPKNINPYGFERKIQAESILGVMKSSDEGVNNPESVNPYGFERKLQAESILGVMKSSDEGVMFLIKWKDSNKADLVSSEEANINCPDLVIKYYEENLYLKNSEGVWKSLDST